MKIPEILNTIQGGALSPGHGEASTSLELASNNPFFIDTKNSLYSVSRIQGERWNKNFPYQLIVVLKELDGTWRRANLAWQFTLPFPPSSLEIDMPFAINTSATLGGVIEEHNGAPFRTISLSGTTGILPLKGYSSNTGLAPSDIGIFAGTVNAVQGLITDASRTGLFPLDRPNVVSNSEFLSTTSSINKTSGYYQSHLLKHFLETYVSWKKTQARDVRLAFASWKDNSVWLVTPMAFRTSRTAESPFEYRYSLQFKSYGRIELDGGPAPASSHSVLKTDPNAFQEFVNKLQATRLLIENSRKVLTAIRADIDNALYTPLREIVLMGKAISGATLTLADLPRNIILDTKESFVEFYSNLNELTDNISRESFAINESYRRALGGFALESGKTTTQSSRQVGSSQALTGAGVVNQIFNNPEDNFEFFTKFSVTKLRLPIQVQNKINQEKQRVSALTRKDLEIRRDKILSVIVDYAHAVNAGSDTYTRIYGVIPNTTANKRAATDQDFETLFELNKALSLLNSVCVSTKVNNSTESPMEYIAGLASQSGIAFQQPRSKRLVPFLYNHTLEQMASIYLGNPERWHEIAALNGLTSPFIDEEGFDLYLLLNGQQNRIVVSSVENLFVNQVVYISSSTVNPEKRSVVGIEKVSTNNYILSLSGEPDLDKLKVSERAKLHAYLPNTINSQMSLYIPSQDEPSDDFETKPIPGIDYFNDLVRVGGVSILLDSSNDIVIVGNQTRYAVGLTNIVQKAKIALSTPKGSLINHPGYGLPVKVGQSTADVNANDVLQSIQQMFSEDPTFTNVSAVSVIKNGPTVAITANVEIAGINQSIPITTEIRR